MIDILFDSCFAVENSSAGLLMVSQTSLDNSVFLHGDKLIEGTDKKRQRHRSAGDNHIKVRSNSLFSGWRPRHSSGDNGIAVRYSELVQRDKENMIEKIKESDRSDESKIAEKDSGVVLVDDITNDASHRFGSPHSVNRSVTEFSDASSPSPKNSPTHSLRMPVTENDPLGLFRDDLEKTDTRVEDSLLSLSPVQSPTHQNGVQLVSSTPFAVSHTDDVCGAAFQCNSNNNSQSRHVDKLCQSNSLSDKCLDTHEDLPAIERTDPKHRSIERTNSSPDCLGTSEKFKLSNLWSVKEYFSPQSPHKQHSSMSLDESHRDKNPDEVTVQRGGSLKRHNEALSGFLKYASSAVANKINELKQSLQSPSKFGSSSSLGKSLDESEGYSSPAKHDQSKNLSKKYSCSLDMLSSDSSRDTSSDDIKAVPYGE